MKIKIIDLLNKIANDEEVPKEIIYNDKTYNYVEGRKDNWKYQRIENGKSVGLLEDNIYFCLNDEVEILNEAKEDKIQKIYHCETSLTQNEVEIFITENLNQMVDKINELIDVVNELKRDK